MNKDQIKGKMEEIKGDLKERIGGATKDRSTQAEGFVENKKGKIRGAMGDLEEQLPREDEGTAPQGNRDDPDRDT